MQGIRVAYSTSCSVLVCVCEVVEALLCGNVPLHIKRQPQNEMCKMLTGAKHTEEENWESRTGNERNCFAPLA